ncbi:MAG: helix-turn-helix transcriptional regulator [Clostridia bacterium]|nr:helix-turn-helix transcriptional regulator [Clostridia bacterium]
MEIKFAETMKKLRKDRGNTQEELAEHLGISVQAVSKWERGDGMPDIALLPRIASFYDTTVDFLLGCDSVRKQEDIAVFKEKAQVLINQGKRRERLELCRAYQKKYPNDESVMFELMHDLFSLDSIGNGDEIITIANRLLNSNNTEYHFGAVQMLAFTNSKLGNYDIAVKYARSIPANRDILRSVLKGDELVEHCKWYFWKVCDDMYATENRLTQCAEANYTAEDRHRIRKAIYDIFNVIFSDGDFGFWNERLARICRDMARSSAEIREKDRAISELEEMCEHLERYQGFVSIDHTSPLVKGLHYDAAQVGKSSEESLAKAILRDLNENPRFKGLEDDDRFISIKAKLEALA